jgi:hypothetical protein
MTETNPLAGALLSKLEEQIAMTDHLITLIPPDRLHWKPLPDSFRICDLLGHLLECLAGVCASLYAVDPDRHAHFARLRDLPVNHECGIEEARARILEYNRHIREGFDCLSDDDLARRVPTVFVPKGEPVMTLLLGNLEHLINHKHQLFWYLKLLAVPVSTRDLYTFR